MWIKWSSDVYFCLFSSIHGYEHGRPVISFDETNIHGQYNYKMMIAMGVDCNNQIFSLAFSIVENESYNSWYRFLNHVKNMW